MAKNTTIQRRPNKKTSKNIDFIFNFKKVDVDCEIDDEMYNEEEQYEIVKIIDGIAEDIMIDKSYVEFKENKHEDVFLVEEGWNDLCKIINKTNKNKKELKKYYDTIQNYFGMMILGYMYNTIAIFGYDIDSIDISIKKNTKFMVKYIEDTINEWKHYPGKWQTWKIFNGEQ